MQGSAIHCKCHMYGVCVCHVASTHAELKCVVRISATTFVRLPIQQLKLINFDKVFGVNAQVNGVFMSNGNGCVWMLTYMHKRKSYQV